jgi:hypothetical protein
MLSFAMPGFGCAAGQVNAAATAPMKVTRRQEWENPTLHNIPVKHGEFMVCAYVSCEGSGPWGKLDDFL